MLPRRVLAIVLAAAATACGPAGGREGRVQVVATVLGCDGKAPARVFAGRIVRDEVAGVLAEGTGRLIFDLKARRFHRIRFGAVHHRNLEIPLLAGSEGTLRLEARLGAWNVPRQPVSVTALGNFNGFSGTEGTLPLARQPDGTWSVTLHGAPPVVEFLLTGEPGWWMIQGTGAEAYRLDDAPDRTVRYLSLARATDGRARIEFDPARLPGCPDPPEVRFADETTRTARFARAYLEVSRLQAAYFEAVDALEKAGGTGEESREGMLSVAAGVRELAAAGTDDVVGDYLELQELDWLPEGHPGPDRAARVLRTVPPEAPAWSLSMSVFRSIALAHPDQGAVEEYARRALETQADEEVLSAFLFYLTRAAFDAGRGTEAGRLYDRLLTEFPASWEAEEARAMWGPDRPIQTGRKVPAFSFPALDRRGERITDRALAGRPYLIDFWSTSCGPCVGHLPTLRSLQERHRKAGFTILSVSVDSGADVVIQFRLRRPMPWLHAILEGGMTDPAALAFGVYGVPTYVLVGKDGTIAAEPWEMLGPGLERTVNWVLGGG